MSTIQAIPTQREENQQLVPKDITVETVIESICRLSEDELHVVAIAIEATNRNQGCSTPSEEFIDSILSHYNRQGLEPKDIIFMLNQFVEQLDEMLNTTKATIERYPERFPEKE